MLNRPSISNPYIIGSIALFALVTVSTTPAQAGFQWTPPDAESAPQTTAPLQSAPPSQLVTRAPQTLPGPLVIEGSAPSVPPMPMQAEPNTLKPPASAGAAAQHATPEEKPVRGFANNVPLSVALRQILPSEYGFSAAQDVSLNTLVSWQGGRLWRPTVEDMLKSAGMAMREEGKMIRVSKTQAKTDASPSPAMVQTSAQTMQIPQAMQPASAMPASPSPQALSPAVPDSKPLPLASSSVGGQNAFAPNVSGYAPPQPQQPQTLGVLAQQAPAMQMPADQSMPSSSLAVVDSWSGKRGDTLRKVLEAWSHRAHVELSWQAEYDYPLQATVSLTGTFEEAVRGLLLGFQEAQPQPIASLHSSPVAGQSVLVVQVRGNNYSE